MPNIIEKLLQGLTSAKGVALAAPVVVGLGLLLSIAGDGTAQSAKTPADAGIKLAAAPSVPATAPSGTGSAVVKVADTFSDAQEKAIGEIVRKYLLKNPEILMEVSQELERRQKDIKAKQQLKMISVQRDDLFRSPHDYVLGNKDAKIVVVEFFDYNCGWCKRALGEVSKLVKEEPNVRYVMKEFPIFGEHSEFAARAAMASIAQDKYWDLHVAMMKERRVTKDNVLKIAERVGIDVAKLKADMEKPEIDAALKRNASLAQSLGIEGTPGFVIDGQINPGFLPAAALKQIIADIRQKGCQVC